MKQIHVDKIKIILCYTTIFSTNTSSRSNVYEISLA